MRRENDARFQASLHGIEIKSTLRDAPEQVPLSEEMKLAIEKQKAETFERLKKRHGGQ